MIRALPLIEKRSYLKPSSGNTGWEPGAWGRDQIGKVISWHLDLEIAFTALGIKPLTLAESPAMENLMAAYGDSFLKQVRLDVMEYPGFNLAVFDPVRSAEVLSVAMNCQITPDMARAVISNYKLRHELLGYPEDSQDKVSMNLIAESTGLVESRRYYSGQFHCQVYTPSLAVAAMDGLASAAAVVEQIRENSSEITSVAEVRDDQSNPHNIKSGDTSRYAVVRVSRQPDNWSIIRSVSDFIRG